MSDRVSRVSWSQRLGLPGTAGLPLGDHARGGHVVHASLVRCGPYPDLTGVTRSVAHAENAQCEDVVGAMAGMMRGTPHIKGDVFCRF